MSDEMARKILEDGMRRGLEQRFIRGAARLAETAEWAERDPNIRPHLAQQVLQVMAIRQQLDRVIVLVDVAMAALAEESVSQSVTQREGDA